MDNLNDTQESSGIFFTNKSIEFSPSVQDDSLLNAPASEDDVIGQSMTSEGEAEEVRTLFISGLPIDTKPRELYLLFRTFKGYESSLLKTGSKLGKPTTPVGFVTFKSRKTADIARIELQGVKLDPNHSSPLRLDFAKSNTRKVTKVSRQLFSSPIPNARPSAFAHSTYASVRDFNSSQFYSANFLPGNQWHSLQAPTNQMISPFAFNITYQSGIMGGVGTPYAYQSMPAVSLPFHHAIMANNSNSHSNSQTIGPFCTPPRNHFGHQEHLSHNQSYSMPMLPDKDPNNTDNNSNVGCISTYGSSGNMLPTDSIDPDGDGGGGNVTGANDTSGSSGNFDISNVKDDSPSATLFVCNLGCHSTEDELKNVFASMAGFVHLRMYSKGTESAVAFVDFTNVEYASEACDKLQGTVLPSSDNRGIRIEFVKNKLRQIKQNISEKTQQTSE
ncbi:hypothetical protein HELRODRAFT_189355 [Helobdella robusta]|uniref:RRM domain-containing protein n=1 Tax=Helobdella robusta TaxID=6412 RepID=T1FQZ9_HELRO|nr:hypothetical protein HELRODRAFT_189355 [Helobdella robusta]ESN96771.1 hypothetical protein HELRODRAFT_189355 [Helobdella robusta]